MFLLVSAHPNRLDMTSPCKSNKISINLGKTFHRISCWRKIAVTWIPPRSFAYLPSFFSHILDFIYWTVLFRSILNGVTLKIKQLTMIVIRLQRILFQFKIRSMALFSRPIGKCLNHTHATPTVHTQEKRQGWGKSESMHVTNVA